MFNFKKIGKKVLSSVLGATLAMGSFLNTQIVKAGEPNIENYWDPSTMLSNAKFILGDENKDEIEKLKEEFEKTGKFEENLEEELGNLLNQNVNAKKIYDAVKECITDENADFRKLNNNGGISEITEAEELSDNVKCKIASFGESENKKAIVFIVVSNGGTLTEKHMEQIKNQLKTEDLITQKFIDYYDCKNVNFIIRPQDRNAEFKIGELAIFGCKYATINAQGANINVAYAIDTCEYATINVQKATINASYAIIWCYYAKINAQGANINTKSAIGLCKGSTIDLRGATINVAKAISDCGELNTKTRKIMQTVTIYYDDKTTIPSEQTVSKEYLTDEPQSVKLIKMSTEEELKEKEEEDRIKKEQKEIERKKKEKQERKRKEQQGNDTKYKKVETNNETINGGNNKKQSVLGIIKEHPVISAMVAATEFVLTPLLIFKNKIIDGVKNIFGKNQNQKFVAKRIKTSN